jgi:SAM-dependent methyltransferase
MSPVEDPERDVNRHYFVDYVVRQHAERSALRVLDFGCGSGELLRLLRNRGIECLGADVFYAGSDEEGLPEVQELIAEGVIKRIPPSGTLPFDDAFFDLIVSDQVFEHVEDLEATLAELDRVLRAEGLMYHHFPTKEVIREGHIGIPLAHRFRPGRARFGYVLALRTFGLGKFKDEQSDRIAWTRAKLAWVDQWCTYRTREEVDRLLAKRFIVTHREIDYCRFRADGRPLIVTILRLERCRGLCERIFRRLAFDCWELRKLPRP